MSIKRENILKSKIIYDYTPFTHLDYPGYLAAIIWFSGCNMRCDYCYNSDIVFAKEGQYCAVDIIEFLQTRQNLLDGVVLSGGEATLHPLAPLCEEIKKLGFKIKLDTNGSNPSQIATLLENKLIDFIALDYKAPKSKFSTITHAKLYDNFSQTLDFLITGNYPFEVRTTLHDDLLDVCDINEMIEDLYQRGYTKTYYIQQFLDTKTTISNLHSPTKKLNKSQLSKSIKIEFR